MPGQSNKRMDSGDYNNLKRMLPHKRDALLVEWVHNKFMEYADVLRQAMPKLRKLEVQHGFFALRTANIFNPVETIKLHSKTDPNASDIFSEEQLAVLRYVTLGKADMKYNADKPLRLLRQLAENAH